MALVWLLVAAQAFGGRPAPKDRKFNSTAVDNIIQQFKGKLKDPLIATLFENCYPNTLDTTIEYTDGKGNDTFVITGDIHAMWLRDSTNQLLPYVRFAPQDSALSVMLKGAVRRQLRSVLLDEYANAFNIEPNGEGHQDDKRKPPMTKPVFEGKYELDSLAAVLKLTFAYWNVTKDNSIFDKIFIDAMTKIVDTMEIQQRSTAEDGSDPPYYFDRGLERYPNAPAYRCGLSKSAFRPSDDVTKYPFLVPSNIMAAVELDHLIALCDAAGSSLSDVRKKAVVLAQNIRKALANVALTAGTWCFEVDGNGRCLEMDDGNVPSLLSVPYLGFAPASDPIYRATRAKVLSSANPWYFQGSVAKGIGSPHTGENKIWPMALIMQALTSTDDGEITQLLQYIKNSAQATGFMHESFNKDNANDYTRSWFAWANALFGELILHLADTRPYLIF